MSLILDNLPALLIAVPLLCAFLIPVIGRFLPKIRDAWIIFASFASSLVAVLTAITVYTKGTLVYVFGAAAGSGAAPIDSGGIPFRIIFTIDGFGAFMLLSAAIVSFAVVLYLVASQKERSGKSEFYALYLLLTAGIFGMVSTGDLFNLFVFLEINTLSGAALVSYHRKGGIAVEGALKYLIVNTVGGLMVLFSVGLLYAQYNSLNMAYIASQMTLTTLNIVALVLFITALAMKSGAVPFHFATPDAYSVAPSGITALMVVASQAGLYGLFRILFTVYGGVINTVTVGWVIIVIGILSMVIGVTMALPQKDIKRLLAYHAVSQTGYMLLGVGVALAVLGDPAATAAFGQTAMEGGLFHIINHALYKGLLFLAVGAVIYRTGVWSLSKLGGLGHNMKWTMVFFLIGALAIAGIPPFNGFASKLMIYESVFAFNPALSIIAMVVSILTLASFMKVFHSVFMGPKLPEYENVKEVPKLMIAGMVILTIFVIGFGLMPDLVVDSIVTPAANALLNQSTYISTVLGGFL
ncbi:MAG TPA: proton-conducting transporter membrane subunit [Methanocorpusculum sp.]|nr:proton-conducting transporter membrane subunit [Methanocorpusculum sp.]